jgi:FkbM family methyltransferase
MDQGARLEQRVSAWRGGLTAATINGLARFSPYVESEIRGLRQLVGPGSVCFDIGAAAGLYTMALSHLAGPTGRVHSVEPLPFANLQLARLVKARRASNVCWHAVALGSEPGVDIMHVPLGRFGMVTGRSFLDRSATGPDPNEEFDNQIAVSVTVDTLDALCAREGIERLQFIKIDVEGAELQVLEGGEQVITDSRPAMLIEIEARHAARYGQSTDAVTSWLFERGYTMHTWQRGWNTADAIDARTRNYLFQPSRGEARTLKSRAETPGPLVA